MATAPADTTTTREKIELLAELFINSPTNGTGADIVHKILCATTIFTPFDSQGHGEFLQKETGRCFHAPVFNIHAQVRRILESEIDAAAERLKSETDNVKEMYSNYGKALTKVRTRNFLHGVVQLIAEMLTVPDARFNVKAEVIPTKTDLVDFLRQGTDSSTTS